MATKSYTDIPQSETLSKILSPESADMYYPNRADIQYQGALPIGVKHGNPLLSQEIPCWSLAALLDILNYPSLYQDVENKWSVTDWTGAYPKSKYFFDSPVDACVDMVIKLHEQNLL